MWRRRGRGIGLGGVEAARGREGQSWLGFVFYGG